MAQKPKPQDLQTAQEPGRRFLVRGAWHDAAPLAAGLYPVATPIGNLSDITIRALDVLAGADVIACEDTRVTRVLLDRYGIATRPVAYHEHNAEAAGEKLLAALDAGKSVALASDAGTPLVSDPGFRLVEAAIDAGHRVVPVPGPSAPLAALVASGLPTDGFFFAGFLPSKTKARSDRLGQLGSVPGSLVVFESPNRLAAMLKDAALTLGSDRKAAVCRELTKLHEEIARGSLGDLAAEFAGRDRIRGEIVVVIAPPEEADGFDAQDVDAVLRDLLASMPVSRAASEAAKLTGRPRRELYQALLAMKESGL